MAAALVAALCALAATVEAVPAARATNALHVEHDIAVTVGFADALQDPLVHNALVTELEKVGDTDYSVAGVVVRRNLASHPGRRLQTSESLTISVRLPSLLRHARLHSAVPT
jgi:hypothetical protein